ncbi:5'/3'-nucleotidase SurE [Frankia sp. R43]|uniref:5'/3'-nucleotidase SurE n=1 Tax=Frankia sp. R43 TaxID=269536 RepID=UPI0009FADA52|nr:5'/3'-nucleotidase SurE [Frankia sp. R43]
MLLAALVAGAGAAGCGGDEKADGSPVTTSASPTGPAPIDILVTNDDGVGAAGIDAVVNGLKALPAVTVTVVAPAANQSGTGGKTTQPTPAHHDAATASGVAATAVDGFPADSVLVALDVLGLKPDVVVSGINQGQNLGPVVDLSGTVGAARAAASRGIPSIASSMGLADSYDYSAGVTLVVDWVTKHRAEFAETATSARTQESVANLNIPNCAAGGKLRGLKQLPTQTAPDLNSALAAGALNKQDCASTAEPAEEVPAFNAGYATLTDIPVAPSPVPSPAASAAPAAVPSPAAS